MKLCGLLLCLLVTPLAYASKTVLPDACGNNDVKFDVKAIDDHTQPLTPDDGKALLVFVEENTALGTDATIRYGLDGKWAGATHGSQYFLVQVAPGEHHICASMQAKFGMGSPEHYVGTASVTAEAGKVYYYGAVVGVQATGSGTAFVNGSMATVQQNKKVAVQYSLMSEDDGKYRVKAGKLAQATPSQ